MKNKFRNNKKSKTYRFLLVALLVISVGYALLTATLKVRGSLNIAKNTWNVYFANVDIKNGSVAATTTPTSDNKTTTEIEYAVNFTKPGDFYEFTVDIVNAGTIDAMISGLSNKVYASDGETPKDLPAYLESTITYADGVAIKDKHLLAKRVDEDTPTTEKIKVRVAFKTDITPDQLPKTSAESLKFKVEVTYQQADETAKPVRVNFVEDSWSDIISAYESGNTAQLQADMENGTTREVLLDLDNDGTAETTAHLRIANLTSCSEVSVTSKSACGFVLEFVESIFTRRMNQSNYSTEVGKGSNGSWKYTDMRAYLNSSKYLEGEAGEVDYANGGFLNALPSDLKNKIKSTTLITGHSVNETENYETTDNIYLFSNTEIFGDNPTAYTEGYDAALNTTRQLDYYSKKGVTKAQNDATKKNNLSGTTVAWFLRTPFSKSGNTFFCVLNEGRWGQTYASEDDIGVSPAFRLAD